MRRFLIIIALCLIFPFIAEATCTPAQTDKYGAMICGTTGLNNYIRLAETSGTAAADIAGGGSSLTGFYQGGFTLNSTGLLRNNANAAVIFNGSTGYGSVPNSAASSGPDDANGAGWTFEMMMNQANTATQALAARTNTADTALEWQLFSDVFEICIGTSACSNSCGYADLTATGWSQGTTHLLQVVTVGAGSQTLSSLNFYVDGKLGASKSSFTGQFCHPANTQLDIGARATSGTQPNNPFNGTIDEVAIYSSALTQDQIAHHWLCSIGFCSPAWPLAVKLDRWFMNRSEKDFVTDETPIVKMLKKGISEG